MFGFKNYFTVVFFDNTNVLELETSSWPCLRVGKSLNITIFITYIARIVPPAS